ncbi:MAG: hypothetical protein JSR17_05750 [Proteobacteria bacterium]|nr:hypothetical protein [Pseudomonadota bacterium]
MKASHLLAFLLVSLFSLSTVVYATQSGGGGGAQGDSTRERSAHDHDRGGQGEKNRDSELQAGEMSSASETGIGTPLGHIRVGEPHDKNYSYNHDRAILKDHR